METASSLVRFKDSLDKTLQDLSDNEMTSQRIGEKLEEIRDKGYGISKGEREPGAYSVVAPIWDANNSVIASLCIAGPLYRLSAEQLDLNIKSVLGATAEISKKMGHTA